MKHLSDINRYEQVHACALPVRRPGDRLLSARYGWFKSFTAFLFIGCLALLAACEKDGALIKVFGIDSSELMASENSVTLTKETSANQVLAITWEQSDLSVSDKSVTLPPSVPKEVLEVSATSDFSGIIEIMPQSNTYAFTGAALNALGKNLGFTSGVSSPMYFRVRSALGVNTEAHYSNAITVNVTCFSIDMSTGFILNADKEDTGFTLFSPESNGEYSGFTGVTAWLNWYLLEGDGVIWGNLDVDGNAFVLSGDENAQWNMWYPGQGGCYFTTLSTYDEEWTATLIPSLKVSGAIEADMTFDRNAVKWYVSFTTSTDNATVKVSSDSARLYNPTTSTDDAAAIKKTLGFVPQADSTLTFEWDKTAAGDITIAEAGDYTLTLYLADPKKWTFQLKPGKTVVVEPISEFLYLPGIDDGISGGWTFDNYLQLVSEDDSTFAGTVLVNSLWGYQMGLAYDDWENVYKMGAAEGTLEFKGAANITAPDAGMYLIQADLKNLSYSHTELTGVSYAGLNDNWSLTALDASAVTGVYTGSVNITTASEYGCQLILNEDWATYYGGSDGALKYKGTNITNDASLAAGSYDLVVNLRSYAYAFLSDKIYIGGLNDAWDFTSVVLNKTATGVYTGTASITTASSWGIKIYLYQDNWDDFYGGSFESMEFKGANITNDQSLAPGDYNITVDFINNTCSFEAQ
ncbi:MAG: DUF5114 domain-containing protein [Bacteroidales bacterium]